MCVENDTDCHKVVAQLRAQQGSQYQKAADNFDATHKRVHLVAHDDKNLDPQGLNSDHRTDTWANGRTTAGDVYLNKDLGAGDLLITEEHEGNVHVPLTPPTNAEPNGYSGDALAYQQLSSRLQASAPRWGTFLYFKQGFDIPGVTPATYAKISEP